MNLGKKYIKSIILWIITIIFLSLIVLLPRDIAVTLNDSKEIMDVNYDFSLVAYGENISEFTQFIWEEKGLGETSYGHSVLYEVWRKLWPSLWIIIPAFLISMFIGVWRGILDYKHLGRKTDVLGSGMTSFFISIPDFFLIILIQITIMFLHDFGIIPRVDLYGRDNVITIILAMVFLSIYPTLYMARITTTCLIEEDGKDYITTARGKGTPNTRILYQHKLKNCYATILSQTNTIVLYILSNLFVVEFVTNYRGAAHRFYQVVYVQHQGIIGQSFEVDVPLVIGFVLGFTVIILISNWISITSKEYLLTYLEE